MQQIVLIIFMIGMIVFEIAEHRRFTKFSERLDAMDRDYWKIYKAHLDSSGEHIRSLVDIFDTLREAQESINGIIAKFVQDTGEATVETAKRINALGNVSTKLLDDLYLLQDGINGLITTTDSRWKIVQDSWAEVDQYMTNRVRKPDFEDFLYWLNWHHGVQVMVWNVPELASVRVTMYYHRVADRPLVTSRMFEPEDLSAHMESILESMFDELFKEAESYEHENREEEAGAPEGGDAGHQEAEQDAVLPGKADGKLVQSELAEDRLGNPPEAEKGQGLADVTYDYDYH